MPLWASDYLPEVRKEDWRRGFTLHLEVLATTGCVGYSLPTDPSKETHAVAQGDGVPFLQAVIQ
jgi:hypothetical protein